VLDRNHDGVLSRDEFSATIPYTYAASAPASYMPLPQNPADAYGSSPLGMYGQTPVESISMPYGQLGRGSVYTHLPQHIQEPSSYMPMAQQFPVEPLQGQQYITEPIQGQQYMTEPLVGQAYMSAYGYPEG